jgi:hypothetical protein
MADQYSQATGFSIKILEGPLAGTNIFLDGRALPYEGVGFGRQQRVKTTWYTGNRVATQQKMGSTLKNTVIHGMWKDVFLGDGKARALVRTFEDLVDTAVDVEVAWGMGLDDQGGTTGETIVRRGIVKSIDPKYERPQDIEWEIEFEWSGTDDSAFAPVLSAGVLSEKDGFGQLVDDTQQVSDAIDAEGESLLSKLSGLTDFQWLTDSMDDIQNRLASGIETLDTCSEVVSSAPDLSLDVIQRVQGACDMIAGGCARLGTALTGYQEAYYAVEDEKSYFDGMAARMRYALWPTDDPIDYLDGQTTHYDMVRSADEASASAKEQAAAVSSKEVPEVAKELKVPAGTDLRDIAGQEWGDPDSWWDIANFNGMDGSRVPDAPTGPSDKPYFPIAIPVRSTGRGPKPYGGAGC